MRAPGYEPHDDEDGHRNEPDDDKRLERGEDPACGRDGKPDGEDRAEDCPDDPAHIPIMRRRSWQAAAMPVASAADPCPRQGSRAWRSPPVRADISRPPTRATNEQVILRALHKDPQQRFPGAKALAQSYTNALQSSKQTIASPALQTFEPAPAQISLMKVDRKILPADAVQAAPIPWWQNRHYNIHKAIVSLALMAIFIIPLSLGFLLGRERAQVPQAFSAQFASALHKAPLASTPTPTPTPLPTKTVHPASGKTIPPSPHHKHKHQHHPENGNDNANGNEA